MLESKDMGRYRLALMTVGILCLAAAAIHGAWLWYMPRYPVLASLDAIQMQTMLLLNAAITLFLFMTALATVLVARATTLSLQHVRGFALLVMGFWAARFLLELIMPLSIPLLFIEHPGVFAKAVMAFPVVILAIPLFLEIRQ